MSRALALTDTQMAELRRAAALLPVGARELFLQQVARRLGDISSPPTNGDVQAAIVAVLGGLGVLTPVTLCDAAPTTEKPDG
jgi:hypothetical protein